MRTDTNLARRSFRFSKEWQRASRGAPLAPQIDRRLEGGQLENGEYVIHSLSGNERNHFFANCGGESFENLSALSGLDNPADSRGFALLDYDQDGWQDVALVNANEPLFNLYHNEMGAVPEKSKHRVIAIRFEGGSRSDEPSNRFFACRDGYGALVTADLGDMQIKREHRCGEGFSVQNSATMVLGIGERSSVGELSVRWPSGKKMTIENVPADTLLTAHERSFTFTQVPYQKSQSRPAATSRRPKFPLWQGADGKVHVYTTTATWCAVCAGNLSDLENLEEDGVALFGVPIDVEDDPKRLDAYVEKWKPPYRMLTQLGIEEKDAMAVFLSQSMRTESPALPSSVITDSHGRVLEVMQGIPTLSQVRKSLAVK